MQILPPLIITSRLLPGFKFPDGSELSIDYALLRNTRGGPTKYIYTIDIENKSYQSSDLRSGMHGGNLQNGLESLLSFLTAAGDSYRAHGMQGENSDLFAAEVTEWAYQHYEELTMLAVELAEGQFIIE
jgi:hypothetical protein